MAVPTPSSDRDNIFNMSVNRPLIPTYPSLKVLVKITLVKKPIRIAAACAANATVVFITEYSVRDFDSNFFNPFV